MTGHLLTWTDKFGGRSLHAHAQKHRSSIGDRTPPAPGVSLDAVAIARVNHGRWIADCPTEGCSGAEYVNLDEPLFFCCECRNEPWGHHPIQVGLPDAKTITGVTRHLIARPNRLSRNWLPGETVAQLRTENRQHGIHLGRDD